MVAKNRNRRGMTYRAVDMVRAITPFAKTLGIEKLVAATGVKLIGFYQKFLSPHKGFSCAYRRRYGGQSCSAFLRHNLETQNLDDALVQFGDRLQDCRRASQELRFLAATQNLTYAMASNRRRRQRQNDCSVCDCGGDCLLSDMDCDGVPDCLEGMNCFDGCDGCDACGGCGCDL